MMTVSDLERELGGLQARMETVEHELQAIRSDVREIRDALVRAKGGWMALLLVFSAAASLGAWIGKYAQVFLGGQP
jgi:chromosome condensin MukBEF ATPase and DNA-binding subunit MukB